jgi:hypothetical protein
MKAVLVADPLWLMREPTLVRRLVVGLVDEKVRTLRVCPRPATVPGAEEGQLPTVSPAIVYPGGGWRWWRHWQIARLGHTLAEQEVDVIHAMDGSLIRPAARLGRHLQAPVVVSVWSATELGTIPPPPPGGMALLAATRPLAESLRRRAAGGVRIEVVSPGAFSRADEEITAPLSKPDRPIGIVIVTDGRADTMCRNLLAGLAIARRHIPSFMCFLDASGADQHALWLAGRQLNLLDCLTIVSHEASTRDWLMHSDLVIQPQAAGVARTLTLEAMAAGRPVIAVADEALDYLHDGRTAMIVPQALSPERWAQQLVEMLRDPAMLLRLGESARQYVRQHHSPAQYIARTLEVYRRLVAEPIRFQHSPATS